MPKHDSAVIAVRVIPNAKKDEIVNMMGDGAIKIRVRAKPIGGKANAALLKFLSKKLSIPIGNLIIQRGLRSRNKQICVSGLNMQELKSRLDVGQEDP